MQVSERIWIVWFKFPTRKKVQLAIGQNWLSWWVVSEQATSNCLNQRWSSSMADTCVIGPQWVHHNDFIMGTMASQITSLPIVYSTVYSGADQRKHKSSASLAFVGGIHRWPVNSPHKGPVTWTRKFFPFDDVIMKFLFRHHNVWYAMHVSPPPPPPPPPPLISTLIAKNISRDIYYCWIVLHSIQSRNFEKHFPSTFIGP